MPASLVTPKQAAIVLLRLIQLRTDDAGPTSRVQISEATLKMIWGRFRLSNDFMSEVQEWLGRTGWTLFYAGKSYALVRTAVVAKWARLTSKRLGREALLAIERGEFEYDDHDRILFRNEERDLSVDEDGG
jgi:hypothetical protein